MKKLNISKEILEHLYFQKGKGISEIAEELSCSKSTVINYMRELFGERYKTEAARRRSSANQRIDKEMLKDLYFKKGLDVSEIAKLTECHSTTIRKALQRNFKEDYNVKRRKSITELIPKETLYELYFEKNYDVREIAEMIGFSIDTVRKALRRYFKEEYKQKNEERKRKKKENRLVLQELEHWMNVSHYYAAKELSVKPKAPINSIFNYITSQYEMTESKKYLKYIDNSTKPRDLPEKIPLVVF